MKRARLLIWLGPATVALILAGSVAWLLNRPATTDCDAETPANHEIRATKVVVQPWFGTHHVYGIFMIPNRYNHRINAAIMTVRGFDHHSAVDGRRYEQHVAAIFARPGHYLLRGYVPTRMAVWSLINGRFGDLRHPCNWTLAFIERSR